MLRLVAAMWLAACVSAGPGVAGDDEVAARVNGVPILRTKVERLAKRMAIVNGELSDATRQAALDAAINAELIVQHARAEKIEVPDAEVERRVDAVKGSFPDEAAFQQALAERQITEAVVREDQLRNLQIQYVVERLPPPTVSAQAVEAVYRDNPSRFQRAADVRISHILFQVPPGGDAGVALHRANKALARCLEGEDFGALAKELSDDILTRDHQGDLGFVARDVIPQELAVAAFALKPGENSGVIQSPFGYHIIKATEVRKAGLIPLEEVRAQIEAELREQARAQQQTDLVDRLKKQAKIEIVSPPKP